MRKEEDDERKNILLIELVLYVTAEISHPYVEDRKRKRREREKKRQGLNYLSARLLMICL